jgi:P27 family predicted phage terminase small subunit
MCPYFYTRAKFRKNTTMRGRTKQPTALAKIKGTFQPCRYETEIDDKLTFVYGIIPTPPEHLNSEAKEFWNATLSAAQKINGYISFIDLNLFSILCQVHSEIKETEQALNEKFYIDKNGIERPNPRIKYLQDLRKQFIELCREFGFSPSSRSKIKLQDVPTPPQEDEFQL